MLTTKPRTILATAITASSLAIAAGGAIAPAAFAKPNNHGYQRSHEALRKQWENACDQLHGIFNTQGSQILGDLLRGDNNAANADILAQGATLEAAKQFGCGWATRIAPPSSSNPAQQASTGTATGPAGSTTTAPTTPATPSTQGSTTGTSTAVAVPTTTTPPSPPSPPAPVQQPPTTATTLAGANGATPGAPTGSTSPSGVLHLGSTSTATAN